jgi:CheY-like chemotaxis protein
MPKQLLLVDDSVTIHRVVAITFAREDYAITSVKSADEGIARARDLKPDVVLADAGMSGQGGKTGYDVCAAIKGDPATAATTCLILTGNFNPYDEAKGQRAGADGFVVKPFETQALIDKVNDLVKKGSSARPAAAAAPTPPAPQPQIPVAAPKPPVPVAQPIEPLSKPLSVVAAETPPKAPAPTPIPQPQLAKPGQGSKTMMGFPAVVPPIAPPPPAPTPSPSPPPLVVASPPPLAPAPAVAARGHDGPDSMPSDVPQMPRPSMIPHTPTPQPRMETPPAPPRPSPPRATLMGIPTVNPAAMGLPPGAVAVPPLPAPPKPAAWAPPVPAPAAVSPPPPAPAPPAPAPPAPVVAPPPVAAPVASSPMSSAVSQVVEQISSRGPEYAAVANLSREVLERICWEVVPELAEAIIKEQLDRLVKERNQ